MIIWNIWYMCCLNHYYLTGRKVGLKNICQYGKYLTSCPILNSRHSQSISILAVLICPYHSSTITWQSCFISLFNSEYLSLGTFTSPNFTYNTWRMEAEWKWKIFYKVENVKWAQLVNLPRVYGVENWSSLWPILNWKMFPHITGLPGTAQIYLFCTFSEQLFANPCLNCNAR